MAALFAQDRVKIAGRFPKLEDELCSYCGAGRSPNLLDAMVWAPSDLMAGEQFTGMIEYYRALCEQDARGWSFSNQRQAAADVALRAPDGLTALYSITRRMVSIPLNGVINLSQEEATPLVMTGWQMAD